MNDLEKYRGDETILVVDDDVDVSKFLTNLLHSLGYNVLVAANGLEAVDIFKQNKEIIKVILLDVVMPIKDGLETYKDIKEIQPDANIIFISGFNHSPLNKIPNVRCLQKPCQPLSIAKSLREVLAENSSVPVA